MARVVRRCLLLLALTACQSPAAPAPPLSQESAEPAAVSAQAPPAAAPQPSTSSGVDPRLPVVGDPLGLLSKPSAPVAARAAKAEPARIDPGALMASSSAGADQAPLERDARAVARGQASESGARGVGISVGPVRIVEKSASDLVRRASQGGTRAHVLLLYAAYCKACRGAMPAFVELARSYKTRGVAFTAASVDDDPDAFAAYAPVLQGALEPFWIRSEGPGTTRAALVRAGLQLPGPSYGIPLFAVFAGQNRLVAQGHTRELKSLGRTLDGLL